MVPGGNAGYEFCTNKYMCLLVNHLEMSNRLCVVACVCCHVTLT